MEGRGRIRDERACEAHQLIIFKVRASTPPPPRLARFAGGGGRGQYRAGACYCLEQERVPTRRCSRDPRWPRLHAAPMAAWRAPPRGSRPSLLLTTPSSPTASAQRRAPCRRQTAPAPLEAASTYPCTWPAGAAEQSLEEGPTHARPHPTAPARVRASGFICPRAAATLPSSRRCTVLSSGRQDGLRTRILWRVLAHRLPTPHSPPPKQPTGCEREPSSLHTPTPARLPQARGAQARLPAARPWVLAEQAPLLGRCTAPQSVWPKTAARRPH